MSWAAFETYRGHRVAAGPEVFAGEIPLLSRKPCDGNRALSVQESNHESQRVLGRDRDAHMHAIRHQVPLDDLTFLLFRQRMQNRAQLTADLPEDSFPPPFRHEDNMLLSVPLGVG
jgi:hypothetical protein